MVLHMDVDQPRKTQRVSKACDACHRRKAKCYWRYPSCVDCIRLKLDCTFTRSKDDYGTQDQSLSTAADRRPSPQPPPEPAAEQPLSELEQAMKNNIEQMVVAKYFNIENDVFPIFSSATFHSRLRAYHAETESEGDPAWLSCLQGVLAACGPHLQLSEPDLNEATAKKHLQLALSHTNQIMLQAPTLQGVQALACIVACSRHPVFSDIPSSNLLAVAIRMSLTLHLHRLDEIMDISPDDRLERIRLFWCLYILDKEFALEFDAAPLIDDDNIRLLEPRLISDDRLGLVESVDQLITLNLFTARQRLAQIASKIWKGLHTFKAQHRPKMEQLETTMQLNEELARWKKEWFQFGSAIDIAARWPEKSIEHLANLQCRYFMCLLKRNFDRPSKATEMRDKLKNGVELDHQALNMCCVIAARDTLYLTRAVGKGGLLFVFAAMTYTVPAIVMVLSNLCMTVPSESQQSSDMNVVKDWLEIQGFLIERMDHVKLRDEYVACREMYETAETRRQGRT